MEALCPVTPPLPGSTLEPLTMAEGGQGGEVSLCQPLSPRLQQVSEASPSQLGGGGERHLQHFELDDGLKLLYLTRPSFFI